MNDTRPAICPESGSRNHYPECDCPTMTMSKYAFKANENKLTAAMARGHMTRKGHELRGVWVYGAGFRTLQRTCCK